MGRGKCYHLVPEAELEDIKLKTAVSPSIPHAAARGMDPKDAS